MNPNFAFFIGQLNAYMGLKVEMLLSEVFPPCVNDKGTISRHIPPLGDYFPDGKLSLDGLASWLESLNLEDRNICNKFFEKLGTI